MLQKMQELELTEEQKLLAWLAYLLYQEGSYAVYQEDEK